MRDDAAGNGEGEQEPPIEVLFVPQTRRANLPVEVIDRRQLLTRMSDRHWRSLQRAQFHQLVVCTSGQGVHHVDFKQLPLSEGTVLHIRPGQVQKFELTSVFDACIVVWPVEHDPRISNAQPWYPGSRMPSAFQLEPQELARLLKWVEDLRCEQERTGQSSHSAELMRAMLSIVVMLLDEIGGVAADSVEIPQAYLDFREALERRLFSRPSVSDLAGEIGYSARTLDRACQTVAGQTAKQVVDERLDLELRRLLADTSRSMAEVRDAFGFTDPSNFAKFVRRHLGQSPADFRQDFR